MTDLNVLKEQTLLVRKLICTLVEPLADRADETPPGWKNNLRWHLGHLVLTPRLLTHSLRGEPTGLSEDYRRLFMKGTTPLEWKAERELPSMETLREEMIGKTEELFATMAPVLDEPFRHVYTTTPGVVLHNASEGLLFSYFHDGIHLGLILALKRALG